jgi:hypothetical protein
VARWRGRGVGRSFGPRDKGSQARECRRRQLGDLGDGKDTTANGYQGLLRYQGLLSISSRAGMVAELKPVWHSALLESGVSCGVMLHFCTWLDATWLDTESVVQQAWR